MYVVYRKGGKRHSAVVVVYFGDASLPSKEKKKKHNNFIILLYCKGRGYIVKVKSQCPLREQYVGLLPFGLWTFSLNLNHFF